MSSLIQEINHYPKESVYNHFFRICFPDDVIYEKITRKQMVELIIQQYTPENIVDVCTVKELKLLKRIVENIIKKWMFIACHLKRWRFIENIYYLRMKFQMS